METVHFPSIVTRFTGKDKTSRTFITNLDEIGKALKLPNEYIIKNFSFIFNTPCVFKNREWYLKGIHFSGGLHIILRNFIVKLTLCDNCNTHNGILVKTKKMCTECGHISKINKTEDRISRFIYNKQKKLK
jgi:hypothetical protein